jgi:8-oxo-dGTP pyrophosphatase MutT (NUDIX family)
MKPTKQVGTIPVRRTSDGSLEILLVTSRRTGRWIIPKGWPSKRLEDPDAAAREAVEEAGVIGRISKQPIGSFEYSKSASQGSRRLSVDVYLLYVETVLQLWPEQRERSRSWFRPDLAATKVHEPELANLITGVVYPPIGACHFNHHSPEQQFANRKADCFVISEPRQSKRKGLRRTANTSEPPKA